MNVTVAAVPSTDIPEIPDAATQVKSQANQDAITVTRTVDTNTYTITASDTLESFALEEGEDPAEWVILDVNTGESTITKVALGGTAYTSDDVTTATAYGLAAGHAMLPVAFDALGTGKTYTFTMVDGTKNPITITVVAGE